MKRTYMRRRSKKQTAFEKAYAALREKILERDTYRCRACQGRGCPLNPELEVHHVVKRSHDKTKRLDRSNLITLCRHCHLATDLPFAKGRLVILALGNERFEIHRVTAKDKFEARALGRADAGRSGGPNAHADHA